MPFPIPASKIETRHYINGTFTYSSDKATFPLHSPYNHEKIVDMPEATVDDTNAAVAAAKAAFPSWAALDPPTRGSYMRKFAALVRGGDVPSELAQLDAMAMGRAVSSYFDPILVASGFDHWAAAGYEVKGATSLNTAGFVNLTLRQPIGPVACIIPWNAPLMMFAWKVAPALAAGCTVVLKSSEKAPLAIAKIATLAHEAGFPPGVINIISGHGTPAGATLSSHMDIRMVNFTGSTATGKKIQEAAARSNLKRVVLELGGKSPALIFDDADLEKAAAATAGSLQLLSGQACVANSRVYVQENVAEKFKAAFVEKFKATKMGDPLQYDTAQGPQADKLQFERIKSYLQAASEGSGKLETGGKAVEIDGQGFFVEPTVYSGMGEDEKPMKDEIFGPFVSINTFRTEQEAIDKANDTEFGLYASVFSRDINRALRVAKAFESGTVGINCTSPTYAADMPFGGYKGSGQGREGFGYALEGYLEEKAVFIKLDGAADPGDSKVPRA